MFSSYALLGLGVKLYESRLRIHSTLCLAHSVRMDPSCQRLPAAELPRYLACHIVQRNLMASLQRSQRFEISPMADEKAYCSSRCLSRYCAHVQSCHPRRKLATWWTEDDPRCPGYSQRPYEGFNPHTILCV